MTNALKKLLLDKLSILLNDKINMLNKAIASTVESRDLHTKSSAGDKHETSRAMIQIELDNLSLQLKKNTALKYELSKIDLTKKHDKVGFGALAFTNEGNYFISIGIGKVVIENECFYCVSLASPIGKQLSEKKTGETLNFMNKKIMLQKII